MILYMFYRSDSRESHDMYSALLKEGIPEGVDLIKVSMDRKKNEKIAKEKGIKSDHAFLFETGEKLEGRKSKEALKEFLQKNTKNPKKEEDNGS